MTLEQLKIEAEKLGYYLVKKNKKPKMLPCVCGCKRRDHWFIGGDSEYKRMLKCKKCDIEVYGKNDIDVINKWNEMIESQRLK